MGILGYADQGIYRADIHQSGILIPPSAYGERKRPGKNFLDLFSSAPGGARF
jgi:hypothetical protein